MPRKDAPVDRGCVVGIIFFILGLGTLLPWNFFLTATMYFQRRLQAPVNVNVSELLNGTAPVQKEYYFNNWMTLLSQLPLLLFTFLNSFLYQRVSEMMRIAGSLVFIFLLFLLTAVLVKIDLDQDLFFSLTMATIWFINSFGAVLQGSLFGLVGMLPRRYSTVFMSGQGLAGTFATLAMILSIASETDFETAALGYFITPCVGTLVTVLSYLLLPRLEFYKFYSTGQKYEQETNDTLLHKEENGVALDGEQLNGHTNGKAVCADNSPAPGSLGEAGGSGPSQAFLTLEEGDGHTPTAGASKGNKASLLQVFKKVRVMAFCVTFVFTVTLSVFPAVTADVKTRIQGKWVSYFIPVCCFLAFNLMDWFGRTITTWLCWPKKESPLFPALVCARVVFIPLLMLCNVEPRWLMPVWFSHDAWFAFFMLLFAGSSGYFVCLSMSYAPQLVEPQDAETAGALMTFFLALGLSLGAALSFALRALV
ncbi:equilibrative nucleoside transporter 2 isoform X2 [Amia ocellicauda]